MENVIIAAFANPIRIKLLCCLAKGRKNVQELIGTCDLAQSAVSQHLIKLKKAGLIQDEKEGKYVYYALTNPKIGILANELRKYATISTP
jgi:ArsR family transcriptional regulator